MDIKTAINKYVKLLRERYIGVEGYYADFDVEFGRTYAKIISFSRVGGGRSAWGFIVMNPPKSKRHLQVGDLLKSAGWSKPATNIARGNILKGTDMSQWTGPLYVEDMRRTVHIRNTTIGLLKNELELS